MDTGWNSTAVNWDKIWDWLRLRDFDLVLSAAAGARLMWKSQTHESPKWCKNCTKMKIRSKVTSQIPKHWGKTQAPQSHHSLRFGFYRVCGFSRNQTPVDHVTPPSEIMGLIYPNVLTLWTLTWTSELLFALLVQIFPAGLAVFQQD